MDMSTAVRFAFSLVACAGIATAQAGWQQRNPAISPAPRSGHAMAFDIFRGETVLFGGVDVHGSMNDTLTWDGTNWTAIATASSPAARSGHALAFDFIHGVTVLFGGGDAFGVLFNDTWTFDGVDWTLQHPTRAPNLRRNACMAFDPGGSQVLLFGGIGGVLAFDDSWLWDGTAWTRRSTFPTPPARHSHGMSLDFAHNRVVVNGGISAFFNPVQLDDTWAWSGSRWTQIIAATNPPPIADHSLTYDGSQGVVVRFGGSVTNTDVWLLDGDVWHHDAQTSPRPRAAAAICGDLLHNRTVLFGGRDPTYPLGDTWEYAASPLARTRNFGSSCPGSQGTPALRAPLLATPMLGSPFPVEVFYLQATGLAAIAFGFSDRTFGSTALPASMGPLGMPGCTLLVSPDSVHLCAIVNLLGRVTIQCPNQPALIGTNLFAQGFVFDPAANALGALSTNAIAAQVGPY